MPMCESASNFDPTPTAPIHIGAWTRHLLQSSMRTTRLRPMRNMARIFVPMWTPLFGLKLWAMLLFAAVVSLCRRRRAISICDPAGGSGQDSFTLTVAHGEGDIAVLDCIREVRPPFSPENVVAELAGVLRSYGLSEVTGDAYSGEFVRELFRGKGISYNISKKSKSEIYIDLLPMLNSGRVALLDNPKMVAQLCDLERRTTRGTGRDIVDHPPRHLVRAVN
jgi:hypothetical protein